MIVIEFLWALYSDGRQSKMADSYPNWPSCLLFPGQTFYNGELTRCGEGFEIQGGSGERNCNIAVLGS